jgi:hypothetical protein
VVPALAFPRSLIMTTVANLVDRISAEFAAVEEKKRKQQADFQQEYEARQKRLEAFAKALDEMRDIWRPRLEALARQFGERVKVTPKIEPSRREATFAFESPVAKIELRFSATTDRDVTKLILGYDLEILPVLLRFEGHAHKEFPLEAIDREAAAGWIDDRIVDFVKTYLRLHEGDY